MKTKASRAIAFLVLVASFVLFQFSRGGDEDFILLFLWENNTAALQYASPEQLVEQAAWFNEESRSLTLRHRKDRPTKRTKVVVYYQADALETRLVSRVYRVSRFPFEIPLSEPIELAAAVTDKDGQPTSVSNIVDNRNRLLAGSLRLTDLEPDGTVQIEYGGERVLVAPGWGWQEGRVLKDGTVSVISVDAWDQTIEAALAGGLPVTRLSLVNHGLWPKTGVTVK